MSHLLLTDLQIGVGSPILFIAIFWFAPVGYEHVGEDGFHKYRKDFRRVAVLYIAVPYTNTAQSSGKLYFTIPVICEAEPGGGNSA